MTVSVANNFFSKHFLLAGENHILPEWSSFGVFWLETRPGEPNHKTGIPPSLYTLRVTDFLQKSAGISIKLERPLKVNFSVDKLQKMQSLLTDIMPTPAKHASREKKEEKAAPNPIKTLQGIVCSCYEYDSSV